MQKAIIVLFAATLFVKFGLAQEVDPIADELNKAKQAYEEALKGCKKKLDDDFHAKMKEIAEKSSDLQVLKQIKAEHEAFKAQGKLPTSSWMKVPKADFGNALQTPRSAMETAYKKARDAYIKALAIEKAEGIEDQHKKFQAQFTTAKKRQTPVEEKPYVIGTWAHQVLEGKKEIGRYTHKFYSNGRIGAPDSAATWTVKSNVLILRFPSGEAPQGYWEDVCRFSSDSLTYVGRNQKGMTIVGTKIAGDEKVAQEKSKDINDTKK